LKTIKNDESDALHDAFLPDGLCPEKVTYTTFRPNATPATFLSISHARRHRLSPEM
jgi:hypothetical protein